MVDSIHLNKLLPSLSATKRVKPVGHRQSNNQQNLFKETFKQRKKKKKKKEGQMVVKISDRGFAAGRTDLARQTHKNKDSKVSSPKKKIDIRV